MDEPKRADELMRAVERSRQHVTRVLARQAAAIGVTEQEGHLLAHMARHPTLPIAEIQRAFRLRPSTLTNVLDRLEQRGFARRELNPRDHRSFLISLTPAGRRAAARAREVVGSVEAGVARRVSARDLAGFHAVLAALEHELG
jgi:MarR family transcriptional regulator, organic hydroperoxide resistance regulator